MNLNDCRQCNCRHLVASKDAGAGYCGCGVTACPATYDAKLDTYQVPVADRICDNAIYCSVDTWMTGRVSLRFSTMKDAIKYIRVCKQNDVTVTVSSLPPDGYRVVGKTA